MKIEIPNELGFKVLKLVKEGTSVEDAVVQILTMQVKSHEDLQGVATKLSDEVVEKKYTIKIQKWKS